VTSLDFNVGDQPVLDIVLDDATGDLYASTDFGRPQAGERAGAGSTPDDPCGVRAQPVHTSGSERLIYAPRTAAGHGA